VTPLLAGRRVLVTGGTKGTGRAVVLALARAGASVVTCARHEDDAARGLADELAGTGAAHLVLRADACDPDDARRLADACTERFGALDALVTVAGSIGRSPLGSLRPQEWSRVMEANLASCFLVIQRALPLLGEGACVVTVGSRAATAGSAQMAHYTAAKAALAGLTRSLARELGPRGIRVNLIAPAIIEKEETAKLLGPALEQLRGQAALGRLALPDDIADVVLFLVSEHSRYITGQVLTVDGGI
jgi:3-oxoacyl-[acyl-carrier protein] reductase